MSKDHEISDMQHDAITRITALEQVVTTFINEWRTERIEIRDDIRAQSQEFRTNMEDLRRTLNMSNKTNWGLVVSIIAVCLTFLAMASALIFYTNKSTIDPLNTRLDTVELAQVEHAQKDGHTGAMIKHAQHEERIQRVFDAQETTQKEIEKLENDILSILSWQSEHDQRVVGLNNTQNARLEDLEYEVKRLRNLLELNDVPN